MKGNTSTQNKSSTEATMFSTNGNTEQKSTSAKKNSGKTIKDVFEEELKDIYGGEKQIIKALPEIIKATSSENLKQALTDHLQETKEQVKRIEKVFSLLGLDRDSKKCEAIEGLIEESRTVIKDFEEGVVRDCALIIGCQKIEHYEMAVYGSLCELAEVMGKHKIADMLDETMEEEEKADKILSQVAERVNDGALEEVE